MAEDEWINGAPVSLLVLLAFVFGMLWPFDGALVLLCWPRLLGSRRWPQLNQNGLQGLDAGPRAGSGRQK